MSFQNKNLYHLLGNDVEDDSIAAPPAPKEIVKKNTSSKKADAAPASADPSKAKKKSKASGNEGALKVRNDNKETSAPAVTAGKSTKRPFDRQSRSTKTDSKKKGTQGWGNTVDRVAEGEIEGEIDAAEEVVEEEADNAIPAVPEPPKRNLADYFAELEIKQQELAGTANTRKANAGAEEKWTAAEKIENAQETFVAATSAKKTKVKAAKEKKLLDIDATFADSKPEYTRESTRGDSNGRGSSRGGAPRGGARGGARGGSTRGDSRGSSRGAKAPSAAPVKKAVVNDVNFPSL